MRFLRPIEIWHDVIRLPTFRLRRQGKLMIEVPPFYSSQECAAYGYIHQDNRIVQSEFVCLSCGNADHADHNAAKVIAMRGVKQLLAGKCIKKESKRCGIVKSKGRGGRLRTGCSHAITARGDCGKSLGWQHPGAPVVEPRNPRYNAVFWRLAAGDFINRIAASANAISEK